MAKKFPQVKRYGLEGAESMMVVLDTLFKEANNGKYLCVLTLIFDLICINFSYLKSLLLDMIIDLTRSF